MTIPEFDIIITQYIQSAGDTWAPLARIVTALGGGAFYILLTPIICWCVNYRWGIRLGLLTTLAASVQSVLKGVFHQARPYEVDDRIVARIKKGGFGMPSGHAVVAIAAWTSIALWFRKWWLWMLSIGLIGLIGWSRLYLGVHTFLQVAVGWCVGLCIVLLFCFGHKQKGEAFSAWSQWSQFMLILGITLAIIFSGVISADGSSDTSVVQTARTFFYALMFLGMGLGKIQMKQKNIEIVLKTTWWKQIIKVALSIGMLMVVGTLMGAETEDMPIAITVLGIGGFLYSYCISYWGIFLLNKFKLLRIQADREDLR